MSGDVAAEQGDGRDANHGDKGQQQAVFDQGAPSSSRMNLVGAARSLVMGFSPDGIDRVKGNKTPPTAQILVARLLSRVEIWKSLGQSLEPSDLAVELTLEPEGLRLPPLHRQPNAARIFSHLLAEPRREGYGRLCGGGFHDQGLHAGVGFTTPPKCCATA